MAYTPEQLRLYKFYSDKREWDKAYQALEGGGVAPVASVAPAAPAASGLLSSLNSADASALQGLLSQFARAEEERQFADAGNQGDGSGEAPEEYDWNATWKDGRPVLSMDKLQQIYSGTESGLLPAGAGNVLTAAMPGGFFARMLGGLIGDHRKSKALETIVGRVNKENAAAGIFSPMDGNTRADKVTDAERYGYARVEGDPGYDG